MPYIKQEDRPELDFVINQMPNMNLGDLNYVINKLMLKMTEEGGGYAQLCSLIGTVECAKQEFYRRVIVPYEDQKIQENGDIY